MPHCLVSFGSNLGDRMERIRSAAQAIAAHEGVATFVASRLYETPPIGGPQGQEPFLNGVARIETSLGAVDVLKLLQEIELNLGRQRFVRWDSRSIDLDVVLYGDLLGENPRLEEANRHILASSHYLTSSQQHPSYYENKPVPRFLSIFYTPQISRDQSGNFEFHTTYCFPTKIVNEPRPSVSACHVGM